MIVMGVLVVGLPYLIVSYPFLELRVKGHERVHLISLKSHALMLLVFFLFLEKYGPGTSKRVQ